MDAGDAGRTGTPAGADVATVPGQAEPSGAGDATALVAGESLSLSASAGEEELAAEFRGLQVGD